MTLNVNSLLCRQCYACCDGTAETLRGFCYKVALYLCYLRTEFDNEIQRASIRISSIILDKPASKVELASGLGYICS